MSRVLTLIVKPGNQDVLAAAADKTIETLSKFGSVIDRSIVLSDGEALDLYFQCSDQDALDTLKAELSDVPVDACIQQTDQRQKRLLLADMDSTIIENECIDELADFAGVKDGVAAITARAMAGALVFEDSLRERVGLLKGLPETVLETCYKDRIRIRSGARTLLQTAKAEGLRCVLVSGGFTFFTARIAEAVGFDRHVSNQLDLKDGHLTGGIIPPLSGPETKYQVMQEELKRLGVTPADVIAVGDGANDIPMLTAAGLGVAVHAKEKVKQAADVSIEHGDLTALLYLMGLPKNSFQNEH